MSIVETVSKPTGKRVTFGIEITAGSFTLNEWGLHESQAKQVNEALVKRNDAPFTIDGLTFSRRAPSTLSSKLAEFMAQPADKPADPASEPKS